MACRATSGCASPCGEPWHTRQYAGSRITAAGAINPANRATPASSAGKSWHSRKALSWPASIPQSCTDGMVRFLQSVSYGKRWPGQLSARTPASRAMTAEAMVCRQFWESSTQPGQRRSQQLPAARTARPRQDEHLLLVLRHPEHVPVAGGPLETVERLVAGQIAAPGNAPAAPWPAVGIPTPCGAPMADGPTARLCPPSV